MDKSALRRRKRGELRLLPEEYLERSDREIAARLLTLPEYLEARRVFAYYGVGREIQTEDILRSSDALGKELYLPVVLGDGVMEYARFTGAQALWEGTLGIPEPGPDAPRDIPGKRDILLVPGLCFDHENYRLGQGGGYYDRYLEKYVPFTIGLARERLMPDFVPRDPHDLPVDILVTEARILRRS